MFRTSFTVEGSLHFPLDMLRYDGCYPATQEDVNTMTNSLDPHARSNLRECRDCGRGSETHTQSDHPYRAGRVKPMRVSLVKLHQHKTNSTTPARWQSFGWQIIESVTERK